MQKLSNILGSGNMTPKERMLAQVKHYLHLERTGAEILSESDIYALSQGWKPKTQAEVNEYNKYLDGMKMESMMKTDLQFAYLQAQLKLTRVSRPYYVITNNVFCSGQGYIYRGNVDTHHHQL